jgi:hypothetical protein
MKQTSAKQARISRRTVLGAAAALAASPALAEDCHIGPPPHHKGPLVFMDYTFETPDFQRQSRDFAAAVQAAGKPAQLIESPNYAHLEMCESLGNPYGPNGRAALAMMKLTPA